MPGPDPVFFDAALAILGPRGLTRNPQDMAAWLTDWRGRYHGQACAMASPADADETARLVRLCGAHGVAIVPQGGNSGMSGGATPDASARQLLVSLRRMNRIEPVDILAGQVRCGAGVILQDLHAAADAAGWRFPLTLGGKGSATVGGLIATNAGGSQVLRHGTMRSAVLGIEAVLADGSIYSALSVLKKDNRGFDLKQLFIGSEGTLGIITAATLRLVPAVQGRLVAWAGLGSIADAQTLLQRLEAAFGATLEGFEVLPQTCLDAVLQHYPDRRAPLAGEHAWHVLVELVESRDRPDQGAALEAALARALDDGILADATVAASEGQAEQMWALRESISSALRARGAAVQHDIAVPVGRMADFMVMAIPAIENQFAGCRAFGFGHLGDGNIHFHVVGPAGSIRGEWENGPGKYVSQRVHDLVTQWHGTISAEHGIGQMKTAELARLGDPVALALMSSVKSALDPRGLFNPGKLLPLAPDSANA